MNERCLSDCSHALDPLATQEFKMAQPGNMPGLQKPISRIVLGTANLVGSAEDHRLLDLAYECGCCAFDTARIYGNGKSEACLGRWVRKRRLRDRITIITKCGHPTDHNRLNRDELSKDIDASLRALGVEQIDLALFHRDDPAIPVGELVDILNELKASGKICAFGVSNWRLPRILSAHAYAKSRGVQSLSCSSCHYGLAIWNRAPWLGCETLAGPQKTAERDWYTRTCFPVLAWSCLGNGFFLDKTHCGVRQSIRATSQAPSVYVSATNVERFKRASKLARDKGLTTAQVALAYVLSDPMNTFAVLSASNPAHFKEDVLVLDEALTPSEREWLNLESDSLL